MNLSQLIAEVHSSGSPDLHLQVGKYPTVRLKTGALAPIEKFPILTKDDIDQFINAITSDDQKRRFKEDHEADFSFSLDGTGRFRVNIFQELEGPAMAFRVISEFIPPLEELGLGPKIESLLQVNHGFVLVTGPTGSGKSTTLASMIDHINATRNVHIITIEDPIEFVYDTKQSLITQRELNVHTHSFSKAIRSALRQDPDIVMVGEMRDLETISAAITLAETGHLVLSTLHTTDCVQTIDRILDVYPADQQQQIRHQLASNLKGVISQVLIPRVDGNGRIAAREIMISNDAIKNCISKGDTHQVYTMIQLGGAEGMMLMDEVLEEMVRESIISKEDALSKASDFNALSTRLKDVD